MSVQLPLRQRRHWYVYVIGVVPDQLPFDGVSVCLTCAVPVIVGSDVFAGAVPDACATVCVGALVAEPDPSVFVAVTVTCNVEPTSACTGTYVCLVAPPIAVQPPLAPAA